MGKAFFFWYRNNFFGFLRKNIIIPSLERQCTRYEVQGYKTFDPAPLINIKS
jgi:hypothetical protein